MQGGSIFYPGEVVDAVTAATVAFQKNVTDPKAAMITSYNYVPALGAGEVRVFVLARPGANALTAYIVIGYYQYTIVLRRTKPARRYLRRFSSSSFFPVGR